MSGTLNITGSLAIGKTTTPVTTLDINGGILASGNIATSSGQMAASGGDSIQWTSAYSYSQIGHLPLTGGTLTGGLNVASGNVGIGTTSPAYRLHIKSGVANVTSTFESEDATAYINVKDSNSGTYGALFGAIGNDIILANGSGATERMRITSTGNVGIGTSSPSAKMQVKGAQNTTVFAINDGSAGEADRNLFFRSYSNGVHWDINSQGAAGSFGVLSFSTNSSERMRIDSSGNVGIGTTSPDNKLTIQTGSGGDDILPVLGANGGKFSLLNNNGLYGLLQGVLGTGNSFIQSQRVDGTAAAYGLLLNPNGGNVGIGTTSPSARMHIYDSTGTAATLLKLQTGWNNPSGNKSIVWSDAVGDTARISVDYSAPMSKMRFGSIYNSGYQTGDAMVIQGDGNVGIGRSNNLRDILSLSKSDTTTTFGATTAAIDITNSYTSAFNSYSGVNFRVGDGTYNESLATVQAHYTSYSGNVMGELVFGTRGASTTNVTERMRITSSGRVGIGLEPYTSSGLLNLKGSGLALKNDLNGSNNNWSLIQNQATTDGASIDFISGQGLAMTIAHNRNVGIGTTTPTTGKLVVHNGDIEVRDSNANPGGRIKGYDNYHSIYFREGGQNRTNYYQYGGTLAAGLGHRFLTGGISQSIRMQIADNGIYMANNVGIGGLHMALFFIILGVMWNYSELIRYEHRYLLRF
jgi:hypothetical protein